GGGGGGSRGGAGDGCGSSGGDLEGGEVERVVHHLGGGLRGISVHNRGLAVHCSLGSEEGLSRAQRGPGWRSPIGGRSGRGSE
ncbi:hypothetical protein PFISCL1PPCAC_4958, partial [Pristionchus fissidentatus]